MCGSWHPRARIIVGRHFLGFLYICWSETLRAFYSRLCFQGCFYCKQFWGVEILSYTKAEGIFVCCSLIQTVFSTSVNSGQFKIWGFPKLKLSHLWSITTAWAAATWAISLYFHANWRTIGRDINMIMLPADPWVIMSFVYDLGNLCFLPTSMKLWHTNLLPCK